MRAALLALALMGFKRDAAVVGVGLDHKHDGRAVMKRTTELVLARDASKVVGVLLAISEGAGEDGGHHLDPVDQLLEACLVGGACARLGPHVVHVEPHSQARAEGRQLRLDGPCLVLPTRPVVLRDTVKHASN